MYIHYTELVRTVYAIKKLSGQLPANLEFPTPANIKEACIQAFKERFKSKDEKILRDFFPGQYNIQDVVKIIRKETDRYRQVSKYLKGGTIQTEHKNLELIAWLLDIPLRPFIQGPAEEKKHIEALEEAKKKLQALEKDSANIEETTESAQEQAQTILGEPHKSLTETPEKPGDDWLTSGDPTPSQPDAVQTIPETLKNDVPVTSGKTPSEPSDTEVPEKPVQLLNEFDDKIRVKSKFVQLLWISTATAAMLCCLFLLNRAVSSNSGMLSVNGQCMQWTGERYELVSCGNGSPSPNTEPYDSIKMKTLTKVNRVDTLTKASILGLWYCKIGDTLELFTANGFHPKYPRLRLKPMTAYMADKYIGRITALYEPRNLNH